MGGKELGVFLSVFLIALVVLSIGVLVSLSLWPDIFALDELAPEKKGFVDRGGMYIGGATIIAASLMIAALVSDPKFTSRTQALVTLAGTYVICSVSWMNFFTHDTLVGWPSQIAFDALQIVFTVASLSILSRWSPEIDLLKGVRFFAGYVLSAFALALPLLYTTVAVLDLLGLNWIDDIAKTDTLKIISAILGLPIAVGAILLPDVLRRVAR